MTPPRRILTVSHDAGGARALVPVALDLHNRGLEVVSIAAGPAIAIWRGEGLPIETIDRPDDMSAEQAAELISSQRPDRLLSASGLYNHIEHTMRQAAAAHGVRTVAVLDSWLNYGFRFERYTSREVELSHPEKVCVIDEVTRAGMLAAGFRRDQLVLTGPPNLEASVRAVRGISSERREMVRASVDLRPGEQMFVFFSDPFIPRPGQRELKGAGGLLHDNGESIFGYTSEKILRLVLDELEGACRRAGRSCKLVVRPHPLEYAAPMFDLMVERQEGAVQASVREDDVPALWIAAADVAVGMMSIALLEAALAGKPALSVQVGLLETGVEDPCVSNSLGYTIPLYELPPLRRTLTQLIQASGPPLLNAPATLQIEGAARRVANVVLN